MKLTFILSTICLSGSLYAQSVSNVQKEHQKLSQEVPILSGDNFQQNTLPLQTENNNAPLASKVVVYEGLVETTIGTSFYDLQTNQSVQNRFVDMGSGTIAAMWTMSQQDNTVWSDRGTGYNYFDGSDWGSQPQDRIESVRTGWPGLIKLANGTEAFLSHIFTDPAGNNVFGTRSTSGSGNWDLGTVMSSGGSSLALSWIRMAAGGADGNSIHIIGHKKFPDLVVGTNNPGYLSYSRSTDGGQTWDIHDSILPEIDSSYYKPFGGDGYYMTAKGNTIAIVLGGNDRDVVLMKSTDNGSTWTKSIIWSFPIDKFDSNIHLVDSTTYEDGRINIADGSFSLSIDDNDEVHAFMGNYYMSNNELNESTEWYPITDGLFHWTEDYGYADTLNAHQAFDTIAYSLDSLLLPTAGNATDYIAPYFQSLSSYPHSTIDANGDIYVTYSGIVNGLYDAQIGAGEEFERVFRHQFVVRSQDGGSTWSEPKDLMADVVDEESGDVFFEGMYGNILVQDGTMYVLYQRDEIPGINLVPADDNPHNVTENQIIVVQVDVADWNVIGLNEFDPFISTSLYPNPASNTVHVNVELSEAQHASIAVVNTLGQQVIYKKFDAEMSNLITLNTSKLKSGIYLVRIQSGNSIKTEKLIIR
jgi:hypothetical protein